MSESNEGSVILGIVAILTAPYWLPAAVAIGATVGVGYLAVKGTSAAIKAHQKTEANKKLREEEQRERQTEYQRRQAEQERKHQEYLQRQAKREAKHKAYLERKEAEREANRMAYFARLTNNVLRFREQYVTLLDNLKNQGLDAYIPDEFEHTCQQILQLDNRLANNEIESARDLSLEIGRSIHGLATLALRAKKQVKQVEVTEQQRKKELAESQVAFIEQMKQNIAADKDDNPQAVQSAIQSLEALKLQAHSLSAEELQEKLIAENDRVDGEIADETVRREIVKSIYKTLKQVGFMVTSPVVTGENVLIKAQKPAGQQAEFAVKLDGHFTFKFDNYEGQKCKTDIDEVTKQLEEIYGITLSNKKVLWENPDRIKKGSKGLPQGGKEKTV
ncbi:MAG: hypothetical protein LBT09_08655 [Planctomycetaceae bacterium]|jgi:hypothetical protein|nr:hypothetical protein [Planctomycetaceae bacterium]